MKNAIVLLVIKRCRVDTVVGEFLEFGYDSRTVLLEGDSEPSRWSREEFASACAFLDDAVHYIGDIELCLELIAVLFKESGEYFFASVKIIRCESPHVHGAESFWSKFHSLSCDVVLSVYLVVMSHLYLVMLDYICEIAGTVGCADSSGYAS